MRPIKQIILSIVAIFSIFCVAFYSSCSKDECAATTCLNKSDCSQGICQCKPGIGGTNCETIYRNIYAGNYTGKHPYNTDTLADSSHSLVFIAVDDTDNYNKMEVIWTDQARHPVVQLPLDLTTHTAAGSLFKIRDTTIGGIAYTGTGSISATTATLRLTGTFGTGGAFEVFNFNSYVRQ